MNDDTQQEVAAAIFALTKNIAEFIGREATNATEPFSGLPAWFVVDAADLMDELSRLTQISKEQLGFWSDAGAEKRK